MDSYKYESSIGQRMNMEIFSRLLSPTVFPRDARGKPGPQYKIEDCLHIVSAINTCRGMLDHAKVRDALDKIAVRYKAARPNSWWLQGSGRMNPTQVANTFVGKVIVTFPRVFVDYSLEYPNHRGYHTRRAWDGDFKPEHQAICINGKNIDHMSTTFANAINKHFTDESSNHLFRVSLFKTITVLLHEIGHVFVTYLSKGQGLSPRQINPPLGSMTSNSSEKDIGEAGYTLEYLVFDGAVTWFHEASSKAPDDQCGTPYLKKASGAYYRILRKTVDDTATFKFEFPFRHEERSTEPGDLKFVGTILAQDPYTDPWEWSETAHLLA